MKWRVWVTWWIIFCIRYSWIFWVYFKKHGEKINYIKNPLIKTYVYKIENIFTFKIEAGCYLELLMPETIKLLGITKSKITKDENSENVPKLEITEVTLIPWNIAIRYFTEKNFIFKNFWFRVFI